MIRLRDFVPQCLDSSAKEGRHKYSRILPKEIKSALHPPLNSTTPPSLGESALLGATAGIEMAFVLALLWVVFAIFPI